MTSHWIADVVMVGEASLIRAAWGQAEEGGGQFHLDSTSSPAAFIYCSLDRMQNQKKEKKFQNYAKQN